MQFQSCCAERRRCSRFWRSKSGRPPGQGTGTHMLDPGMTWTWKWKRSLSSSSIATLGMQPPKSCPAIQAVIACTNHICLSEKCAVHMPPLQSQSQAGTCFTFSRISEIWQLCLLSSCICRGSSDDARKAACLAQGWLPKLCNSMGLSHPHAFEGAGWNMQHAEGGSSTSSCTRAPSLPARDSQAAASFPC